MLLVGMENLEKSLAVPPEIKQLSAIPLLGICPGEMIMGPHKNLYVNIHSSMIHNCQKVGTTQVSINS